MLNSSFRIYFAFLRLAFLKMLAYRTRYYTGIVTYFVFVSVYYYIWKGVYEGGVAAAAGDGASLRIGGFDLAEMVSYVAVGWVGRSFYFNNVDREIESEVREGQITFSLVRPVSYYGMHLATALGQSLFRLVLFSVPISAVLALAYPVQAPAGLGAAAAFLGSLFLAWWVLASLNFCLGVCAVHLKSVQGLVRAKEVVLQLLSGLLLPLSLFPPALRVVCEWLPFQAVSWTPTRIYLGKLQGADLAWALALQAAWGAALTVVALAWWSWSRKRVTVQGG